MKCPHCNTEIDESLSNCPHCGRPLHTDDEIDEPKLSLYTKIFIVVGAVVLVACSLLYYSIHRNDPEYARTKIDPDSTLADQFEVKFDTIAVDTTSTQKDDKAESDKAAKVFSSIRGKQTDTEETAEDIDIEDMPVGSEGTVVMPHTESSEPQTSGSTSESSGSPKVESLE